MQVWPSMRGQVLIRKSCPTARHCRNSSTAVTLYTLSFDGLHILEAEARPTSNRKFLG